MKECKTCNRILPLDSFYVQPECRGGYTPRCKECIRLRAKQQRQEEGHYQLKQLNRKINSLVLFKYKYELIRKRLRNTHLPKNRAYKNVTVCSLQDFLNWCEDNMNSFNKLHKDWVVSGFDRNLNPTIDRIESGGNYTPSNMQWLTMQDNLKKRWHAVEFR